MSDRRSVSGRRGRLYRRRRFKPKKNIFGGAWAAIYLIMGLASWLVWRQGGLRTQAVPLCLYLLQLGVNLFAWPPMFVGGQRRRYAVADSAGEHSRSSPILLRAFQSVTLHPCRLQDQVTLAISLQLCACALRMSADSHMLSVLQLCWECR